MIKLVFRYILPLVIVVVGAILGYNYFFGDADEKANSQRIMSKVKGLGSDVVGLLSSEKEKYDRGKYDNAIEKVGAGMEKVKDQASEMADGGQAWLEKVKSLETEKAELVAKLVALDESADNSQETAEVQAEIENLAKDTEDLSNQISEQE